MRAHRLLTGPDSPGPRRLPLPLVLLAVGLAACAAPGARQLGYADAQVLNPGVHADWVLQEYPGGRVERGPDGGVRQIRYTVEDPQGRPQSLLLLFDERGVLREKRYTGRVVRPRAVP